MTNFSGTYEQAGHKYKTEFSTTEDKSDSING